MSKSSTVTVRETPVQQVSTATAGGLVIHSENLVIDTDERIELVDLTERLMAYVRPFGIKEGMITVWSMHTTCAVFINEFQKALLVDIKKFLEEMVDSFNYFFSLLLAAGFTAEDLHRAYVEKDNVIHARIKRGY